ncbi:DUF1194 domain-containing protein [Algirhabdus cladophorae]|uniref:DUF1194 domain-containing protein n=1 Tax=Algirhabdus cladophorae TaxID=3377108 RepID=UPI003B846CF8
MTVQAHAQCRQALVLGLDVSGSVDAHEYRLQLDGTAGALTSEAVQDLILAMPSAPVQIAVFEWSGPRYQVILVPWTQLKTLQDLQKVGGQLRQTQRRETPPATALGQAMNFGADLLATGPKCWKQTLDISGDGKSNTGPRPRDVKTWTSTQDITINGLVIGSDPQNFSDARSVHIGELQAYYQAEVIKGPEAFIETSLGFEAFQEAMQRKLLRELEGPVLSLLD